MAWIELEGAVNVRDLGGLPAGDGSQTVAGRLLRADNLQDLSPADVERLVHDIGVTTVVDLRSSAELASEGPAPLDAVPGVRHAHHPVIPELGSATDAVAEALLTRIRQDRSRFPDDPTCGHYLGYLEDRPDQVVAAVRTIARDQGAALVHCAAGKDRTGVVVALTLTAVGVRPDAVVADYAATSDRVEAILGRLRRSRTYARDLDRAPAVAHLARPETMAAFLQQMDARYGGVVSWLADHGFDHQDLRLLRAKLRHDADPATARPRHDLPDGSVASAQLRLLRYQSDPERTPGRHELDTSRSSWLAIISTCLAKLRRTGPYPGTVVWEGTLRARHAIAAVAAVASGLLLTAACSSSSSSSSPSTTTKSSCNWATAQSAAACGGMAALVAAAEKEGQLNVITLPSNWANYGAIMSDFTAKYHIHITDANPDGSSQDELNAVNQLKGQSRAPDVLDVGTAFAVKGDQEGILAPYQVATWNNIPSTAKAADSTWYADYGGYVAIGYNSATVKTPPTTFASLLNPIYKNEIAINGNPTQANAAFSAVYAAALANGGSLNNIGPGIAYFKKLHAEGNFVPVTASAATMESGQTPIIIWWDYLLASEIGTSVKTLKIVIPTDGVYASYYDQAISKYAPDPAAARLWEEFLYSTEGQNLWLEGEARPIELSTLVTDGTVNQAAYKALPPAPAGTVTFPTQAQAAAAENVVAQQWSSVIG